MWADRNITPVQIFLIVEVFTVGIAVVGPLLLLEFRPQKLHAVTVLQRRRVVGAQRDGHGGATQTQSQLLRRKVLAIAEGHSGILCVHHNDAWVKITEANNVPQVSSSMAKS